jgi:hypothetical protein
MLGFFSSPDTTETLAGETREPAVEKVLTFP